MILNFPLRGYCKSIYLLRECYLCLYMKTPCFPNVDSLFWINLFLRILGDFDMNMILYVEPQGTALKYQQFYKAYPNSYEYIKSNVYNKASKFI